MVPLLGRVSRQAGSGFVLLTLVILTATSCTTRERQAPAVLTTSLPVKFDPARDPAQDLRLAIQLATASGRRIILDVGGEWCSWCHTLDGFIEAHRDVKTSIERDFVWLKVNWSEGHENTAFLSKYPEIAGYPHLFVLEQDGTLLHSQDTALLEEGPSYNLAKMTDFLARWAPHLTDRTGA